MKKIIFLMIASLMFAANSSEDLNKKLDLILQKMNELEKKVEQKDREIEKLKKELKKQKKKENNNNKKIEEKLTLSNCKNIKASKFSYIYHDDVIPYYTLTYTLTNKYPKKIVHLKGDLIVEDKDDVKILQDYIDRDVNLAPGKSIVIKKVHTVTTDMEKELNGENPKNLKVVFEVIRADLADGSRIECGF